MICGLIKNEYRTACVIEGVRHEVGENCAFLGYYATSSDNFLPTFRGNLLVPYSGLTKLTKP
jgi:hypothetical protein